MGVGHTTDTPRTLLASKIGSELSIQLSHLAFRSSEKCASTSNVILRFRSSLHMHELFHQYSRPGYVTRSLKGNSAEISMVLRNRF